MKAFLGRQEVKDHYLARVEAHRQADEIVKGRYWKEDDDGVFRGCAVGCTLHSPDHMAYESELGIPGELAYLEDRIFENLPYDLAKEWPRRFLEAIPVGADLTLVVNHFLVWLLTDATHGVIRFAATEARRAAIQKVSDLHAQVIAGNPPSDAEWAAARAAARAAVWADAWAAESAAGAAVWAAGAAVWAAAWAAESAAGAAERAAESAAAWAAEWAAAYTSYADKLIELMASAEVSNG